MILPASAGPNGRFGSYFIQAPNGVASDEISAHTGMFDAKTNDGYYELGLLSAHLIRDVVITLRTSAEPVKKSPLSSPAAVPASQSEEKGSGDVEGKSEVTESLI